MNTKIRHSFKDFTKQMTIGRYIWFLIIIVLGCLYAFPIYWMVITSLKVPAEVHQIPPTVWPKDLSLAGYREILSVFMIGRWFLNSFLISIAMTVFTIMITSLSGFAFAYYKFPFKQALFIYLLATLMVPIQIRMIPSFLLLKELGWLNTYHGIIIPEVATKCGFGTFLLRQFYKNISKDLIDAARIDGCSEIQIFGSIGIPLVVPALTALGVYLFVYSWNHFVWPLIIVEDKAMKTLPLALVGMTSVSSVTIGLSWPQKMAGATLMMGPMIVLYILFRNVFIKGISLTGLKG